jgi:hypothetical protein
LFASDGTSTNSKGQSALTTHHPGKRRWSHCGHFVRSASSIPVNEDRSLTRTMPSPPFSGAPMRSPRR